MRLLAIDTSCDESCAAIVDTSTWTLLADCVESHVKKFAPWGGIVPEIASREHLKSLPAVVESALNEAGLSVQEIDGWVATTEPGLIGALLVGSTYAKSMAFALGKPFFAIDHLEGHLYSPRIATLHTRAQGPQQVQPPEFPWICAVVSGGHSEIFVVQNETEFTWLGGTQDDAAGEAFDKVGKLVGLPYPAGPLVDKIAAAVVRPEEARRAFDFPRAKLSGYDLSYSGLKTAVHLALQKLGPEGAALRSPEVLASAQEAILATLVDKLRLASKTLHVPSLVVTGGVACNSRLRQLLPEAYFPAPRHCGDNAAMIAVVAAQRARLGKLAPAPWQTTARARSQLFVTNRR